MTDKMPEVLYCYKRDYDGNIYYKASVYELNGTLARVKYVRADVINKPAK